METPTLTEWKNHAFDKLRKWGDDPKKYTEFIEMKYDYVVENEWNRSVNGKDKPIKRWKAYLTHSLEHRKPNRAVKIVTDPDKKRTKLQQIEDEILLSAFHSYKVMSKLTLKHEECFDILFQRGVFKSPETKTKKGTWQDFYEKQRRKSVYIALDEAKKQNTSMDEMHQIRMLQHPILDRTMKILVVQLYFDKFETEDALKKTF